MRLVTAIGVLFLGWTSAGVSSACDYGQPPLDGLQIRLPQLAEAMVAEASTVEIVAVASTEPISFDERWRNFWETELAAPEFGNLLARMSDIQVSDLNQSLLENMKWVKFTVLGRLKGTGADQFIWSAKYFEDEEKFHPDTAEQLRNPLMFNYTPQRTLLQGLEDGSCSNTILVRPDTLYLVFRDDAGNPLQQPIIVRDRDRMTAWTFSQLPSVEKVATGDRWTAAVRQAASH